MLHIGGKGLTRRSSGGDTIAPQFRGWRGREASWDAVKELSKLSHHT